MNTRFDSRMKFLLISLLLILPAEVFGRASINHSEPDSLKRSFNEGWLFHRGDLAPSFRFISVEDLDTPTTREWKSVTLPHDWSVESEFDSTLASSTGYLPGGIGWYQKNFEWNPKENENVSIYFEAISNNSSVWLNGHLLGNRPNGYISFEYDLNPYLTEGTNTLTVKVDRSKYGDSRWYPGSGIYGNVYLNVRENIHIPTWGVFWSTPEVNSKSSVLNVKTRVNNTGSTAETVQVNYKILDPDGRELKTDSETAEVKATETHEISNDIPIDNPVLWSPETPELYQLIVEVKSDGQVRDYRETAFGIRHFNFDANEGFFLNGENTLIKGVCLHHDAGVFGAAVPKQVWERRLRHLKEAGANAIRISHNPAPPHMLELADSLGFLVMAEAFDEWRHPKNKWINGWNVGEPGLDGYAEHFDDWARRDLQDMILRDRNHTSIIMWSIGNEIDYPNDPYSHPVLDDTPEPWRNYEPEQPDANELGKIAKKLTKWVKDLDTTRPVTAALASTFMSNHTGYPEALDIVGYNYQEDRYAEDHKNYPERIIIGSENSRANYSSWKAVEDNPYVSGQFIWTGIDYLGEAGRWPNRSSTSGYLDLAGFKKARFYIQKSFWDSEPVLQVATTPEGGNASNSNLHWDYESEGDSITVFGLTNLDRLELFVNGRSSGIQSRDEFVDGFAQWSVPFEEGTVRLEAIEDGEVVKTSELITPGKASRLVLDTDRRTVSSKKPEIIHAVVEIEDQKGILAANAENNIQYEVEGPARVIGMESGNPNSHEVYKSDKQNRDAYKGKLLIYLQTTGESGTVNLKVSSEGLSSDEAAIEVQ